MIVTGTFVASSAPVSFAVLPPHAASASASATPIATTRLVLNRVCSGFFNVPATTSNQKPPRLGINVCYIGTGARRDGAQHAVMGDDARDAGAHVVVDACERVVEPRQHVNVLFAARRCGQLARGAKPRASRASRRRSPRR